MEINGVVTVFACGICFLLLSLGSYLGGAYARSLYDHRKNYAYEQEPAWWQFILMLPLIVLWSIIEALGQKK